jgi:hypothetical protein
MRRRRTTPSGTDNASHSGTWTIDLAQTALNWTSGLYNGDLISALQDPGVEVVTCNGSAGCDLVTLQSPSGGRTGRSERPPTTQGTSSKRVC